MQRAWLGVLVVLSIACGDDGEGDASTAADTAASTMTTEPATGSEPTGTAGGSTEGPPGSTSAADTETGDTDAADTTGGASTGAAAPTWDGFAAGFFESYCWECHGPGDALRDYSVLAEVMAEANTIRCGTAPSGSMLSGCEGEPPAAQFPIGANLPTDDERATLVEWIDAGLPES